MSARLKVWSGLALISRERRRELGLAVSDGKQVAVMVAATSQRRAVELLDAELFGRMSVGQLRDYWSETRNATQLAVGTEEGVWYARGRWPAAPSGWVRSKVRER